MYYLKIGTMVLELIIVIKVRDIFHSTTANDFKIAAPDTPKLIEQRPPLILCTYTYIIIMLLFKTNHASYTVL